MVAERALGVAMLLQQGRRLSPAESDLAREHASAMLRRFNRAAAMGTPEQSRRNFICVARDFNDFNPWRGGGFRISVISWAGL